MLDRWAQEGAPDAVDMSGNRCSKELTLGSSCKIKEKEGVSILSQLRKVDWPNNPREAITGKGVCLGATYNGSKAYSSEWTSNQKKIVKDIIQK